MKDLFTSWQTLPLIPLTDTYGVFDAAARLPDAPGLYAFLDWDWEPIYIGKAAKSIRARFKRSHHHAAGDILAFNPWLMRWCSPKGHLIEACEALLIDAFDPPANQMPCKQCFLEPESMEAALTELSQMASPLPDLPPEDCLEVPQLNSKQEWRGYLRKNKLVAINGLETFGVDPATVDQEGD